MKEIAAKNLADLGIGTYTHVSAAHTHYFNNFHAANGIHGTFLDKSIDLPSNFIYELESGYFGGEIGMAAHQDYLITDTAIKKEHLPTAEKILGLDATVASVAHLWANGNYFHWLLNVLPRICMLKQYSKFDQVEIFLVNSCSSKYEIDSLSTLLVNKIALINNSWWRCKRIIATSPMTDDAVINPYGCELLKHYFNTDWLRGMEKAPFPKKLAIARRSGRNIINHGEIYRILEDNGFTKLYCEDFSFADQVEIFKNAEYIVAPHGAGLANIVFCKPATKILEILSPRYLNNCFRKISSYCNLDYRNIIGEGNVCLIGDRDANILVNSEILKLALSMS